MRPFNTRLEPEVAGEIARIYCSRVPFIAALAALVTFALTGVDIATRTPFVGLQPTDINSLIFGTASAVLAGVGRLCRRIAGPKHWIAVAFVFVALAHGVATVAVGTTLPASEMYIVIILLAAAGGIPILPRLFAAGVVAACVVSTIVLSVVRDSEAALPIAVVWLVGVLAVAIDTENYRHWLDSIRSRLEEESTRRQLEEFLSILAHDLRGPIGNMKGLVSVIQDELPRDAGGSSSELLEHMRTITNETHGLLENLLLWGRSRRGTIDPSWSDTTVGDQVRIAYRAFEGSAKTKDIHLTTDIRYNPTIATDPQLLQTVLRNLVSNALKYTEENGSVTITVLPTDRGDEVEIRVRDSGVGMDSESAQRLFALPRQNTSRGTAGESGLGLVLVSELTTKLGIQVAVESERGRGTTVRLKLPVKKSRSEAVW